jgi:zinc protease
MDHLDAATEEDYVNFYKDFYVPENAILSIAGDFDPVQTKNLIAQYFGSIPKANRPVYRPRVVEPPLAAEIRDTVFDNVQLPAVIHTYRVAAQGTPDYYAVKMLSTLLSQGESSRLSRALVNDQQKALFIGSIPVEMEDPGVALVFGIANMGVNAGALEEAMDVELAKVRTALITEVEFQKLRNQLENDFVTANSSVMGIAERLANYEMYYGDASLINTEINRFMEVTREDIRKAAQKYFHPGNRVALTYLPRQAQP